MFCFTRSSRLSLEPLYRLSAGIFPRTTETASAAAATSPTGGRSLSSRQLFHSGLVQSGCQWLLPSGTLVFAGYRSELFLSRLCFGPHLSGSPSARSRISRSFAVISYHPLYRRDTASMFLRHRLGVAECFPFFIGLLYLHPKSSTGTRLPDQSIQPPANRPTAAFQHPSRRAHCDLGHHGRHQQLQGNQRYFRTFGRG